MNDLHLADVLERPDLTGDNDPGAALLLRIGPASSFEPLVSAAADHPEPSIHRTQIAHLSSQVGILGPNFHIS